MENSYRFKKPPFYTDVTVQATTPTTVKEVILTVVDNSRGALLHRLQKYFKTAEIKMVVLRIEISKNPAVEMLEKI